jgi:hypothetical protein
MIKQMVATAVECTKNPGRHSIWSEKLKKYVCLDSDDGKDALAELAEQLSTGGMKHPPINSQFKLVFLTAAIGTLIFVVLCLALTLLAGKEPPPLFEKVIMGFFDLAKIGFGAVVGLLGGKSLQAQIDKDVIDQIKTAGRARK